MNGAERERIVEDVLDRALGPQLIEPRLGLEERILANLAKQPQPRPWWQWMWVPALAAVAILAVVIGMRSLHREVLPSIESKKVIEQPQVAVRPKAPRVEEVQPPPMIANHLAQRPSARRATVAVAHAGSLPRMNVFPAPAPLSDQERLLLALSRRQRGEVEIAANTQSAERERAQKYFDTGYAPDSTPPTSLDKR